MNWTTYDVARKAAESRGWVDWRPQWSRYDNARRETVMSDYRGRMVTVPDRDLVVDEAPREIAREPKRTVVFGSLEP